MHALAPPCTRIAPSPSTFAPHSPRLRVALAPQHAPAAGGSDFAQLAQGLDAIGETVAAEAAVRAVTEGVAAAGVDDIGLGATNLGVGDVPSDAVPVEAGGGMTAEAAALAESGGTMGATHVWQ